MLIKKSLILFLSAMCLFVGCGKKEAEVPAVEPVAEAMEEAIEETAEETASNSPEVVEPEEEQVQMVNPLKEVTKEELLKETGITFIDEYITLEPEYFVITPADPSEKKIAELRFMVGERELTYRAQPTDKLEAYDSTGLYYDWDEEKDVKIAYCDAKYMKCEDASGIYWLDVVPGINYSISCIGEMDESQLEGCATILFDPPSPDDPPVAPPYDYEGTYTDADGNTVTMVRKEDGTYSMEISIFRLCLLEGEANDVDGGSEFMVEDPNGKDMTGVFYVNDDDTYTIYFTEADWTYIKTGDSFEGFKRD